jgi:hypothetical protein
METFATQSGEIAIQASVTLLIDSAAVSTLATTVHVGTVYDGTNVTTWLNNSTSASAAQTSAWSSPGTLVVGTDQAAAQTPTTTPNNTFDGLASEIIITNTALSLADRASLEAYFASRW